MHLTGRHLIDDQMSLKISQWLHLTKNFKFSFITRPNKGSGVIIMDKAEYRRLQSAPSIDDSSKFLHVDDN